MGKRKVPPRAAARAEREAKKRMLSSPKSRTGSPKAAPESSASAMKSSPEPSSPPAKEPTPAPPSLPTSIQPGKTLPNVAMAQPDNLSSSEYKSVQESGVLVESLAQSRQRWITEGIFQKYWTKPTRKNRVTAEPEGNPPKDSMIKLGNVTITVEPHAFEATMYAVKDPRPALTPNTTRPILQYGPPNGLMPPPPLPAPALMRSPSLALSVHLEQEVAATNTAQPSIQMSVPGQALMPTLGQEQSSGPGQQAPARVRGSPGTDFTAKSSITGTPQAARRPLSTGANSPSPSHPTPTAGIFVDAKCLLKKPPELPAPNPVNNRLPAPLPPAAASSADPIILTLAGRAGEDPHLREIMKKVAQGEANAQEMAEFQLVIDGIQKSRKRPSADQLIVDGRSVQYFASEVRAILDIVLASNPMTTAAELNPPPGSDPLVVMLVKSALDEAKTQTMVRRLADKKPQMTDATDLQAILEKMKSKIPHDAKEYKTLAGQEPPPLATNNAPQPFSAVQQPQQAFRSKGPLPAPRQSDISSVAFEFAGGNGDRYLFPKFSILEYLPSPPGPTGQQVLASFLIVRRGSTAEYPVVDPKLDYYQPVTLRLFAPMGRHLEQLARVVAPAEEVRRYMEDIMARMTRAEYVLLAMRLPKVLPENGETGPPINGERTPAPNHEIAERDGHKDRQCSERDKMGESNYIGINGVVSNCHAASRGVLWGKPAQGHIMSPSSTAISRSRVLGNVVDPADVDVYQKFIAGISRKEGEAV